VASIHEALNSLGDTDIRHLVSVSGGKDSTALALYMRETYPQVPVEYIFCDTDCELPETLEYLEKLEALLGVSINRLNALDLLRIARKPGRKAFDIWLTEQYGGFLPSARTRWCTRILKIEPFEAYVGQGRAFSYLGIRADEDRDGYQAKKPPVISEQPNIVPVYPFKDDGIGLPEVRRILEESGLGLPAYYQWRTRSGCYFCFYQQLGEWQRLKEHHPDLFEAAKAYEKSSNGRRYTWVQGRSLQEIASLSREYPLPVEGDAEGCAVCHV
jgi:3'-phosphoadenosine 5'-phosphosulfate sulfotransferase (PAPS reductase)/FAD synthetase